MLWLHWSAEAAIFLKSSLSRRKMRSRSAPRGSFWLAAFSFPTKDSTKGVAKAPAAREMDMITPPMTVDLAVLAGSKNSKKRLLLALRLQDKASIFVARCRQNAGK